MAGVRLIIGVLVLVVIGQSGAQDILILRSIRECLRANSSFVCLKEKAVRLIDEAINNDQPVKVLDIVDIVKDPNFVANLTNLHHLPRNMKERSEILNDVLLRKIDDFFASRTLKFRLAKVFEEGRSKKVGGGGGGGGGGGKGKGMIIMVGMAMMGMMAQMIMGKMALMSGAALMMAKLALLLSALMVLKKTSGGGGGGGSGSDSHVVYTSGGGDHGGGSGWHRSFDSDQAAALAYRGHSSQGNDV